MSSSPYGRCFRPTKCQGNRVGGIKEIEPAEIHNDTGFTIAIDSFLKRCDQMNEVAVRLAEPGDVVFRHAVRGDRQQAARLALRLRALAQLAEVRELGSTGR